jgi:hypothetical protein
MRGVIGWFEERGEIPLLPPPRVREYAPVTDDPDRPLDEHFLDTIGGVALAIEYCDAHGWMSTRTVRCIAVDHRHPACINAYCHVRERVMTFRLDRIISVLDLRSGHIVSADGHLALFAPYLPEGELDLQFRTLVTAQQAARDGVFALLQVGMGSGRLGDQVRGVVLDYVRSETTASGRARPPSALTELWVDNLAPASDCVAASVARLLQDRAKIARLMPFLLKVARCADGPALPEATLRDLIAAMRHHFQATPPTYPRDLRATR